MAHYAGAVRRFHNAEEHGFQGRDEGADVFDFSAIQSDGYGSLKEGEEVEYDVIQGEKGPQADNLCRANK